MRTSHRPTGNSSLLQVEGLLVKKGRWLTPLCLTPSSPMQVAETSNFSCRGEERTSPVCSNPAGSSALRPGPPPCQLALFGGLRTLCVLDRTFSFPPTLGRCWEVLRGSQVLSAKDWNGDVQGWRARAGLVTTWLGRRKKQSLGISEERGNDIHSSHL